LGWGGFFTTPMTPEPFDEGKPSFIFGNPPTLTA